MRAYKHREPRSACLFRHTLLARVRQGSARHALPSRQAATESAAGQNPARVQALRARTPACVKVLRAKALCASQALRALPCVRFTPSKRQPQSAPQARQSPACAQAARAKTPCRRASTAGENPCVRQSTASKGSVPISRATSLHGRTPGSTEGTEGPARGRGWWGAHRTGFVSFRLTIDET